MVPRSKRLGDLRRASRARRFPRRLRTLGGGGRVRERSGGVGCVKCSSIEAVPRPGGAAGDRAGGNLMRLPANKPLAGVGKQRTLAGRESGHGGPRRTVRHAYRWCMAKTRAYVNGKLSIENFPFAELSDHMARPDTFVWADLCSPSPQELASLAEELSLHQLAVEDAVHEHQRSKLDRYADHLFLSAYAVGLDPSSGELSTYEIAVFILPNAIVTVRKGDGFDIDQVVRRWDSSADLASGGPGFLLHGLLDYIVDTHFAVVQELDGAIDDLEELLFDAERAQIEQVQRRAFELRKSLVLLRRVVLPMREVVNSLMRRDLGVVSEPMSLYYQDVYDHVLRATEWTESLRDLITTILETNLTIQGNRMNLIMKKVTSWAAIIAVPTAITGFYGQNVPYPGFGKMLGLWSSSGLILAFGVGLYIVFRRLDWL